MEPSGDLLTKTEEGPSQNTKQKIMYFSLWTHETPPVHNIFYVELCFLTVKGGDKILFFIGASSPRSKDIQCLLYVGFIY